MSLLDQISENQKGIAGSRAKNRLTIQISFAIQLIMDFYESDFLVLMDYIEDVSIIKNLSSPDQIHLYQVKTKTAGSSYTLATIIREEWYQKLYDNAIKYKASLVEASVVCNTEVIDDKLSVFPNQKTFLSDEAIKANANRIKEAIAKDQKIDISEVDLSKYCFVKSTLTIDKHKEEVEHQFESFLLRRDENIQVTLARSIYIFLYSELDIKFGVELSEHCTDLNEIFSSKGISSKEIEEIIICGLGVQLPNRDRLYELFETKTVTEIRNYNHAYTNLRIDMYHARSSLLPLRHKILARIDDFAQIKDLSFLEIREYVYQSLQEHEDIPPQYSDEYYIRMLIMITLYKFCFGGEGI